MDDLSNVIHEATGVAKDAQSKIVATLAVILILWLVRIIILRLVWKQTEDVKIRYNWKRTLSFTIPLIGLFLISAIWIHAFEKFGAFLGLMTAGLAIAMKDPLTNLAGWFFIVIRHPFAVGDRVQIGEHTGDIIDIRLFQFTMLEIGNWVEADQSTGRIIHLPNGKVFMEPQANFSSGFEYIWNELKVRITFESDWQKAKTILDEIIHEVNKDIHIKAKKEILEASKNYMIYYKHLTPIIYTAVKENGVQLTIRYLCNPRQRRGTENEIWQLVLTRFAEEKNIQFAYPTTRFFKSEGEMT